LALNNHERTAETPEREKTGKSFQQSSQVKKLASTGFSRAEQSWPVAAPTLARVGRGLKDEFRLAAKKFPAA
jgi:hypothetical protein